MGPKQAHVKQSRPRAAARDPGRSQKLATRRPAAATRRRRGRPLRCRRRGALPDQINCVLCPGALLIAHPTTGDSCLRAYWDDPRHRDREAARLARNEREVAKRAAGAAGHRDWKSGDPVIQWRKRIDVLGGSPEEELEAWTSEHPGWRADDTVDREDGLEALAQRIQITSYSNYLDRLTTRLSQVDPANVPNLVGGQHYYQTCESVETLTRCPHGDPMFGRLPPLTTLLLCGTVESRLSVLVDHELRRVKAPHRKAASGAASRNVVRARSRLSTDVRGLQLIDVNRRSGGVQMSSALAQRRRWRDGPNGFGLRTTIGGVRLLLQRLPRQLQVADPRAVKNFDCDFGSQANNEIPYQAHNVKLDCEENLGDATTRLYTRPENVAIARMLPTLGLGDSVTFQVCCFGERVVEYTIGGGNWRYELGQAAVHFLETYDHGVFAEQVATDPREWARQWTQDLLTADGCGGVLFGKPCSFVVKGKTYGRCPYTDPLFCLIANSLDRTACRVALNLDYHWDRDQPQDEPSILPQWRPAPRRRSCWRRRTRTTPCTSPGRDPAARRGRVRGRGRRPVRRCAGATPPWRSAPRRRAQAPI